MDAKQLRSSALAVVAASLLMSACASMEQSFAFERRLYLGAPRPTSEVAAVRFNDNELLAKRAPIFLGGLKGQGVLLWAQREGPAGKLVLTPSEDAEPQTETIHRLNLRSIELLPGRYVLSIFYHASFAGATTAYSLAPKEVTLDAEAGHVYVLDAEQVEKVGYGSAYTWSLTLTDETSGEVHNF